MEKFDFEEELKKLPGKPGVYIMHDSKDAIIYVGKAVSLKNRVRSYFRASTKKTPKIQKMVLNFIRYEKCKSLCVFSFTIILIDTIYKVIQLI